MKKQLKSLLLIAFAVIISSPVWSQASTEGKEFWVALNMTTGTGGDDHKPFICITTQHQGGTFSITNPADPSFKPINGTIPANGYIKIYASPNPSANEIDLNKWYPVGSDAPTMSTKTKDVGLKITTSVDCSVFAGNRLPQSFDAANILPITALQTDYITQDYPGFDHENKGGGYPVTTILATEANTRVVIQPSSAVINNNGTATITKTLNAGQVLYLTGENRASLSGTTITSDKKIAVFTGVNNTDVPGPVSARDHLYEQNMPTDYWGTHFVVTRSMKKDANRIRVTASNNGTEIMVDGATLTTINAGDTYEFELCSATMRLQDAYSKAVEEKRGCEYFFEGDAHYLETSCPCAVFSYDVSENYYIKKNGTSERDENSAGDPAMVWISPLEQQLRKVTFGVMNTDQTPTHYVNIITPTSGASSLEVREIALKDGKVVYGDNLVQTGSVIPVPDNPAYSYARIKLVENKESVYTITSGIGFIAHVYGSGDKESYAYSCGSAAVQQGISVEGITFTEGYVSDSKFCIGEDLNFSYVGTDEITRIDWNFGDGTSEDNGQPTTTHQYIGPGWYDVTASLWGHQVCTDESNLPLGSIEFHIRVGRPDTIRRVSVEPECKEESYSGPTIIEDTIHKDCDSVVIVTSFVLKKSSSRIDTIAPESCTIAGVTFTHSVVDSAIIIPNQVGCDSTILCNVTIVKCLDLQIINQPDSQHICAGETLEMPFSYDRDGDPGEAFLVFTDGKKYPLNFVYSEIEGTRAIGKVTLPIKDLTPNLYTAKIQVEDMNSDNGCTPIAESPLLNITVRYPEDIFAYKFNNVLAVYKKGSEHNKDYEFVAYQWYRNDHPIDGATESVYHTEAPFIAGDSYYVLLTDKNGLVLPSCPQIIKEVADYNPQPKKAQKKLINNRMYIVIDNRMYNAYGQRVQ